MAQTYSWPALSVDAGADFSQLQEQARSRGYEDGYAAGHQQAISELEQIRLNLSESLQTLPAQIEHLDEQDEQIMLDMIRSVCTTLLGVELTSNPAVLESVVAEAVERFNTRRDELTLVIAPEDESWVSCEGLTVVVDNNQNPGQLTLRTEQAILDFDPKARLGNLLERVHAPE